MNEREAPASHRDSARQLHPLPGRPAPRERLIDVAKVLGDYYDRRPDVAVSTQRVAFGVCGHRGSSLRSSFNEAHVLAITQAICEHRKSANITGPLYIGKETHALSESALRSALEVLAANAVIRWSTKTTVTRRRPPSPVQYSCITAVAADGWPTGSS